MKSQQVRLFDVFILGPAMMWIASRPRLTNVQRIALFAAGAGTVLYNWRNYAELAQKPPELPNVNFRNEPAAIAKNENQQIA
jgi:hypothetical protein